MSKKMQLPDELLDMVSAGILTYRGSVIKKISLGHEHLWVMTLHDGRVKPLKWNRETTRRDFGEFLKEFERKERSEEKFAVDDYIED